MDNAPATQYNVGHGQNNPPNYQYNNTQSDPFNSFIHTEDDGAFDNTWQAPDFSAHQQPSQAFDQNSQQWPHNAYQPPEPNYLPMPQFNVDQRYSNPASNYQYPEFNSNPSPQFASRDSLEQSVYQRTADFNPNALSNETPYRFSGPPEFEQSSQTISPAAIESYPNISNASLDTSRNLAGRSVKSIDRPGLHIKPTNQYASVTQSKRFDGFIFVGSNALVVNISKGRSSMTQFSLEAVEAHRSAATVPRYKRKKSRNETMRLLQNGNKPLSSWHKQLLMCQTEKGDGPWHPDREPLVKKLKIAAKKQVGPKPAGSSTQSRSPSSTESSDSDSDDSSGSNSDSEVEKEPDEPSPLPSTKPTDPSKAVEYDLIKAIWAKRSAVLSSPVVRTALAETWEIFKGIRDKWKSKSTNLQQAIDKKDQATEKAFERRVAEQRRLLESCIHLTLKHGHPSIVDKLGENPVLLVIFYQFLADRFKYGEYTGSFIAAILQVSDEHTSDRKVEANITQLMVRCSNIDNSLLEQTKVDKILQRLFKRGDEQGKSLTQKVLQNAKLADKKSTSISQINGAPRKTSDASKTSDIVFKKDRQNDTKKMATDLNHKGPNGVSSTKERASSEDAKSSSKTKPDAVDSKTKVVNVAAKPSGFFSSLKSASKRPGTSTKSEDGGTGTTRERKVEIPSAAASKPAFSFAATMAGLAKQKEEPPVKTEETRKPETAEERRKRLRKEQRRKLRVSFKGDDELVSVRTFEHDPDEEIGHDQSQVRDVLDSKGEGQMLKMHKDLELDDDEDYEPPDEILPELSDWTTPLATNFSGIDESESSRNFASRGGRNNAESPEREAQKTREHETLMAIYTSASDMPLTPREPVDPYVGDYNPEQIFGQPEGIIKTRESEYRARRDAQPIQHAAVAPQTPDISAILQMFNNPKPQHQQPRPQMQQTPDPSNPLAALLANMSNNNQAAQVTAPPPAAAPFNLQGALAAINQPQQHNYQAPPAFGAPQANPVPNLQAILSQIGNQGSAPQAPPMHNYGYNTSQESYPMNEDRKRQLENDENEYGRKKARGGKPFTGVPYQMCKFFQEGKCRKGEESTATLEASNQQFCLKLGNDVRSTRFELV
ncbi:uncharacterized protein KY384_006094 [Bacidia gigantensis]|uniref:uncharacterized protein n=1 Tax=Bacidia gigantensis TaxID=2732470 RepID=UPI001D0509E4|nr:uncharacterized protein KY384_006094 [Bacidia gigantensis]KAG8529457.1 hypothetical protein KY384_006094 [Bacidia gigantensis]